MLCWTAAWQLAHGLALITSTNLFSSLEVSAAITAPATRQTGDFLALLQAEIGKSSNSGAPVLNPGKPMSYGAPTGSYIKPMSPGVPVDLDPPVNEAKKPMSHGVPTVSDTKPMSHGVPTELDEQIAVGEEASSELDLGAPTNNTLDYLKARQKAARKNACVKKMTPTALMLFEVSIEF
jgi:hypothetical protein